MTNEKLLVTLSKDKTLRPMHWAGGRTNPACQSIMGVFFDGRKRREKYK